jgi:hypothetical protein
MPSKRLYPSTTLNGSIFPQNGGNIFLRNFCTYPPEYRCYLLPWRWRQYVPSKPSYPPTRINSAISFLKNGGNIFLRNLCSHPPGYMLSCTLKMDIVCSSETLLPTHQKTRLHNLEVHNMNLHLCVYLWTDIFDLWTKILADHSGRAI